MVEPDSSRSFLKRVEALGVAFPDAAFSCPPPDEEQPDGEHRMVILDGASGVALDCTFDARTMTYRAWSVVSTSDTELTRLALEIVLAEGAAPQESGLLDLSRVHPWQATSPDSGYEYWRQAQPLEGLLRQIMFRVQTEADLAPIHEAAPDLLLGAVTIDEVFARYEGLWHGYPVVLALHKAGAAAAEPGITSALTVSCKTTGEALWAGRAFLPTTTFIDARFLRDRLPSLVAETVACLHPLAYRFEFLYKDGRLDNAGLPEYFPVWAGSSAEAVKILSEAYPSVREELRPVPVRDDLREFPAGMPQFAVRLP